MIIKKPIRDDAQIVGVVAKLIGMEMNVNVKTSYPREALVAYCKLSRSYTGF